MELVRPALDLLLQQIAADPNTVMLRLELPFKFFTLWSGVKKYMYLLAKAKLPY